MRTLTNSSSNVVILGDSRQDGVYRTPYKLGPGAAVNVSEDDYANLLPVPSFIIVSSPETDPLSTSIVEAGGGGMAFIDLGVQTVTPLLLYPTQNTTYRLTLGADIEVVLFNYPAVVPPGVNYVKFMIAQPDDLSPNGNNPYYFSMDALQISYPNHDTGFNPTEGMNANEYSIVALEWTGDRWLYYPLGVQFEID